MDYFLHVNTKLSIEELRPLLSSAFEEKSGLKPYSDIELYHGEYATEFQGIRHAFEVWLFNNQLSFDFLVRKVQKEIMEHFESDMKKKLEIFQPYEMYWTIDGGKKIKEWFP